MSRDPRCGDAGSTDLVYLIDEGGYLYDRPVTIRELNELRRCEAGRDQAGNGSEVE